MNELKQFDKKDYEKLDIVSVTVDGKKSSNIVTAKEMIEKQNIVMNITVKKLGDENVVAENEDVKKDESK